MNYKNLQECIDDLDRNNQLIRIKEEVDPHLEMAAIHLRIFEKGGPAILFEKIKGCNYQAVSNLFGTLERSKFIFRENYETIQALIDAKNNPIEALKSPLKNFKVAMAAWKALPKKKSKAALKNFDEIKISDLPQIKHWPMDGGAFVTLPQVYTEDPDSPGVMKSNLGMYRIQLSGNEYTLNEEIGLHYQLHRGIGVHQTKSNKKNKPLQVSVFIGGPPSHTLAAVMPLPEGISELTFAGALGGKRFEYCYDENGNFISLDADFVITGEVYPEENKPEGPFGDHLGYYSLKHPFPLMKVKKVYAKKNAIWAFTVVGRPPQEDTSFGALIHDMTGKALHHEIPGLVEVNAVDAAGVHPLLLAIGKERYTPYLKTNKPSEILTLSNHILGTGQLSLAKYLFITAEYDRKVNTKNIKDYFTYFFERFDAREDLHFHTNTSIDTLDYSGGELNRGSKVVFASYGDKKCELRQTIPNEFNVMENFSNPQMVFPGIVAIQGKEFTSYENETKEIENYLNNLKNYNSSFEGIKLMVICDNSSFVSETMNNFLWVTFTRSNPASDIYGIDSFTKNKHFGCNGPVVIDARKKPFHAPELIKDEATELSINRLNI